MSRYSGRRTRENKEEIYDDLLEERGLKHIRHHETARLGHPTSEQRKQMTQSLHAWAVGDRFYKLAHEHYGDSQYWWVLAWWNLKPTDAHVKIGEVVRIPGPLSRVIAILKFQTPGSTEY
jgi:hypothetical protein